MRNRLSLKKLMASASLAAAFAAFACTTSDTRDQRPLTAGQSMMSSSAVQPLPGGAIPLISSGPASMVPSSLDQAATMAARRTEGGAYLGPASPAPGPAASATMPPTGQVRYGERSLNLQEFIASDGVAAPAAAAGVSGNGGGIVTAGTTTAIAATSSTGATLPAVSQPSAGASVVQSSIATPGVLAATSTTPLSGAAVTASSNAFEAMRAGVNQRIVNASTVTVPTRGLTGVRVQAANGSVVVTNVP